MRAVIQRVSRASVSVDGEIVGKINAGLLVFLGVTHEDELADVEYLARKIPDLRIFEDDAGKMNLALNEINGEILLISQFTLHADTRKGRRPSFIKAAEPKKAEDLYQAFLKELHVREIKTETGIFGAMMDIDLINRGPVTIIMDSADRLFSRK